MSTWNRLKRYAGASTLLLAVVAGCAKGPGEATSGNAASSFVESTNSVSKEKAIAARDGMFDRLSSRLMEAMTAGGPASAIQICSREAPEIADAISQEFQVRIGRTSDKLRNSSNEPPQWAKSELRDRPTEPRFLELPDNQVGALLPIFLKPTCLLCHGSTHTLLPEVKQQLAMLYPSDQATGYREGDLRGWFWVEVPGSD
ncbi:MAG TPA: DUF3365 domain-containing protein [Pirellulaceae bacterium]|nr:DUF3365 domain-containing protein [Pirellulaceae bacterium]HMO14616.1 DUF3365 domain-containing protein [Pirellulaceae bacterium]HMO90574.1 DUF3365 domain-containing protein [Pirellulaceae bacterium]HMP71238.1 DUF3365 domain-containing protein [Pirellulaceae bacterium]